MTAQTPSEYEADGVGKGPDAAAGAAITAQELVDALPPKQYERIRRYRHSPALETWMQAIVFTPVAVYGLSWLWNEAPKYGHTADVAVGTALLVISIAWNLLRVDRDDADIDEPSVRDGFTTLTIVVIAASLPVQLVQHEGGWQGLALAACIAVAGAAALVGTTARGDPGARSGRPAGPRAGPADRVAIHGRRSRARPAGLVRHRRRAHGPARSQGLWCALRRNAVGRLVPGQGCRAARRAAVRVGSPREHRGRGRDRGGPGGRRARLGLGGEPGLRAR